MAIEIKCNCGLEYRLDDKRAGETFKCRLCGAEIYLQSGVGRASPNSSKSRSMQQNSSKPASSAEIESAEDVDFKQLNTEPEKLYKAKPIEDAANVASIFSDYTDNTTQRAKVDLQIQPQVPPVGWWLVRLVMWACAVVFIFAPWLKLSLYNSAAGQREAEHITGWQMATSVVEEIRYTGKIHPAAAAPVLEQYIEHAGDSENTSIVALGGKMMAIGAAVFLASIAAVPIAGLLVLLAGPRVMALPFTLCLIALSVFTAGWFTAASSEQMKLFLNYLAASNCYMGVSGSVYLMLLVLAFLAFRAGIKPDYKLLEAIKWSRQRDLEHKADS